MVMESARPEIREPIGVVGYGVEGKSTCAYLLARGFRDITVFDKKAPEVLAAPVRYAVPAPGGSYLAGLDRMATVFRSAGVRADQAEIAAFAAAGGALTSQVGLAFALAGRDRIIGVTGTVGKGTCCSILDAMLREAGIPARLGGNIGVPALDLAADLKPGEWLLLELSSFQLSALPVSPRIAVVLRTTTEHLDWHPTQAEYWLHKGNLAARQEAEDLLVHCADSPGSAHIAGLGKARRLSFGPPAAPEPDILLTGDRLDWVTRAFTLSLSETRLKGAFNLENLAAAAAVALELGADPEKVLAAARRFEGLEHRLEFVREHAGIAYYNDSYATRPEAALGAVKALADAPLGLILGGSEKHADFAGLAASLAAAAHVKAIALIGQTAGRLRADLLAAGVAPSILRDCATLDASVQFLAEAVGRGAIALSPACASFGLFENYKERGKAFKRLVQSLG